VLAAFNNKTASEIINFDINAYFEVLDLEKTPQPTWVYVEFIRWANRLLP
jgi:hypothetical protein